MTPNTASPVRTVVLGSTSRYRRELLSRLNLPFEVAAPDVDETPHAGESPRELALRLALAKARAVAARHPEAVVIGCDQVLDFRKEAWGKPETPDAARAQLQALRGQTHRLLSAVVLYERAEPVWRHVGEVRLTMRAFSDAYLDDYLTRNWDSARHSVGAYKLEEEGARLFSAVDGDYFTVLGLPLLPLLGYLGQRGWIAA